jgi:carbon dioxide concentrating mechanism protein CcmO
LSYTRKNRADRWVALPSGYRRGLAQPRLPMLPFPYVSPYRWSNPSLSDTTLGILEVNGWTSAMVSLDSMEKAAQVSVLQAEWNDMLGAVIKITGTTSDVVAAVEAGKAAAEHFLAKVVGTVLMRPAEEAIRAIMSPAEYNPLIEQAVVKNLSLSGETSMSNTALQALGFIETQGFTAVFEAIDTACKAASVQVVGKEKLGGGYVTVVIRGDVAAVQAAVDAAKPRIDGLGKLIACHVIARPSESVMALLPKA